MAEYSDREAFIPFSRQDVVQLCLEDNLLSPEEQQNFQSFCEILSAYYHFEFHQVLEQLKTNFAHLDPDATTQALHTPDTQTARERESQLLKLFEQVLLQANFLPLDQKALEEAFAGNSLINLNMEVDFDDFEMMVCFWRGSHQKNHELKHWYFWKKPITMEVLERVVLLIKFKDQSYFESKIKNYNPDLLNFTPGKTYIYLYKNIPKMDLEVLFPNVKIHMTWKDKLFLAVPAVGAAIPLVLKALPQLLLIIGVVMFFSLGPSTALDWGITQSQVDNILPVLLALLSLAMVLGGFGFKQYLNYKNKKLKFLEDVTDTLFFRNLVCNAGVFHSLIDAAEEEECKEIILAYYHLLQHPEGLSPGQLDDKIENWLESRYQTRVDFNVKKALDKMTRLRGQVGKKQAALVEVKGDKFYALPLNDSRILIDYVWDHLFEYHAP